MLIALILAVQAAPHPSELKTFGDWTVACDNVRRCEMTALIPDDAPEQSKLDAGLSIVRDGGPAGGFTVDYTLEGSESGELHVLVDGAVVTGGLPKDDTLHFTGTKAAAIVAAIANGRSLTVINARGGLAGVASLAGSSAALRYFDATQGRSGGVTAVIAKGPKLATAVPPLPPLPHVPAIRPGGVAAPVSAALAKALLKQTGCAENYDGELPEFDTAAIGGGKTLVLVPCGAGAYNFSSAPMILAGGQAKRAAFDDGAGEYLVNAGFDPKTGRLGTFNKGRGLADCGNAEDYVWDGARFRLVEANGMNECRQSLNWLTTWRAVVDRK